MQNCGKCHACCTVKQGEDSKLMALEMELRALLDSPSH